MANEFPACPSWCQKHADSKISRSHRATVATHKLSGWVTLWRHDYHDTSSQYVQIYVDGDHVSVPVECAADLADVFDRLAKAKWLTNGLRRAAELVAGVEGGG